MKMTPSRLSAPRQEPDVACFLFRPYLPPKFPLRRCLPRKREDEKGRNLPSSTAFSGLEFLLLSLVSTIQTPPCPLRCPLRPLITRCTKQERGEEAVPYRIIPLRGPIISIG